MERCSSFNECRKHFEQRGIDIVIQNGKPFVQIRFMCTVCERRWYDEYKYQYTYDISFTKQGRDKEYGSLISNSVTSN